MKGALALLGAVALGACVAGCSGNTAATATVLIDSAVCLADVQAVSGKTLVQAEAAAVTPACIAALETALDSGTPATATVTLTQASATPATVPAATPAPASP